MSNTIIHKNKNRIGISLPEKIIEKIDLARGDVNRSRYILRLIESKLEV